jgi:hypothetical protein
MAAEASGSRQAAIMASDRASTSKKGNRRPVVMDKEHAAHRRFLPGTARPVELARLQS